MAAICYYFLGVGLLRDNPGSKGEFENEVIGFSGFDKTPWLCDAIAAVAELRCGVTLDTVRYCLVEMLRCIGRNSRFLGLCVYTPFSEVATPIQVGIYLKYGLVV